MSNDKFESWVKSLYEDRERPEKINPGQIWTIFRFDHQESEPGTMIVILRLSETEANIMMLHHEMDLRRGSDVVLDNTCIDFKDRLVCMTDSSMQISQKAFENARYIGNINNDGLNRILNGIKKYNDASESLIKLQFRELDGEIPDNELDEFFQGGILELVPISGNDKKFQKLKVRLKTNLLQAQMINLDSLDIEDLDIEALCADLLDSIKYPEMFAESSKGASE